MGRGRSLVFGGRLELLAELSESVWVWG